MVLGKWRVAVAATVGAGLGCGGMYLSDIRRNPLGEHESIELGGVALWPTKHEVIVERRTPWTIRLRKMEVSCSCVSILRTTEQYITIASDNTPSSTIDVPRQLPLRLLISPGPADSKVHADISFIGPTGVVGARTITATVLEPFQGWPDQAIFRRDNNRAVLELPPLYCKSIIQAEVLVGDVSREIELDGCKVVLSPSLLADQMGVEKDAMLVLRFDSSDSMQTRDKPTIVKAWVRVEG